MATSKIKIDITNDSLDAATAAIIGRQLLRVGAIAKARAQQIIGEEVKDRSGRLKSSIDFSLEREHGEVVLFLESTAGNYALYQHEGTGIYGPKRRPIKPKRAQFLSWIDPDTGDRIFAKEVRGVPAKKFLSRAASFAVKRVFG